MDFFQGSSPPNFLSAASLLTASFCLENQNVDEQQTPTNTIEYIHTQREQALTQASVPAANLAQVPSPPPFPP